jgi:hypothetical protein
MIGIVTYLLVIKGADNIFRPPKECVNLLSQEHCRIDLETLQLPPFNLIIGDLIVARVSASNELGEGDPSEINIEGAYISRKPDKMQPPKLLSRTSKQLTVGWLPLNPA